MSLQQVINRMHLQTKHQMLCSHFDPLGFQDDNVIDNIFIKTCAYMCKGRDKFVLTHN